MTTATFCLKHSSGSTVFIECKRRNGKVKINDVGFAKGNVVSLNDVRIALRSADEVLF